MLSPEDKALLIALQRDIRDRDPDKRVPRRQRRAARMGNNPWKPEPIQARGRTWRDPTGEQAAGNADHR